MFAFFVVLAAVSRVMTRNVEAFEGAMATFEGQRNLVMLHAVSGLVKIRDIFREADSF